MTAESLLQRRPIRLRTDCAVGDRHRHVGSAGPQFLRQEITGHLGARNEDPGAFHVFLFDRLQHPFRLILLGNQVRLESLSCQSLGCPRSDRTEPCAPQGTRVVTEGAQPVEEKPHADRKSTRLNSSHLVISYAVFCLKKKKIKTKYC